MANKLFLLASALSLALPAVAAAEPATSDQIAAALKDSSRPAADVARDAARKPGEVIAFAGIGPGDKVADFIMGGGYYTHVLAGVVGPTGRVYAFQPAEFIQFRAAFADDQKAAAAAHTNVTPITSPLGEVAFPEPLDVVVTVQNYHDMHLSMVPAGAADAINAKLFAALKPGGTLLVVDHSAVDGAGFSVADSLHRAEGSAVRAELEKAGFVFEGEAQFLRNAADPRTAIVFGLRDQTDQFVYRFRKPK